jgi:SNF2 family DNA or RNA helicase
VIGNLFQQYNTSWFCLCSITTLLYDGGTEQRKTIREQYFGGEKFNILLTHYDLMKNDKKFLSKVCWYYLIVDEGHRLKNHECALSRIIKKAYAIR